MHQPLYDARAARMTWLAAGRSTGIAEAATRAREAACLRCSAVTSSRATHTSEFVAPNLPACATAVLIGRNPTRCEVTGSRSTRYALAEILLTPQDIFEEMETSSRTMRKDGKCILRRASDLAQ